MATAALEIPPSTPNCNGVADTGSAFLLLDNTL